VSAAPSLYRRHRPRSFADVVGQEHVVRTLRNAVEQDNVHHAYLFVGSRGTGKTSMAKILAACLNCEHGPTTAPDGTCDSCQAIAGATSLDVIEMDAASNNSVDDIRDLRERVAYAPVSGRAKVYILDEAHMLTAAAWNAFLKTLEEPPPNTVFVLATTEANKILPTVADRCHRFDFTRPTVEQIASVLRRVADQEDIEIPADALALVARQATGSFRDALGTLEQLVTYSGRAIALEDVLAVLGIADADLLFESLEAVATHDPRRALLSAAKLSESGRDAAAFIRDLEGHARDLLVVGTLGEVPAEVAMTPDRDARLAEQAQRVPRGDVVRLLELLAKALEGIRNGAEARTQLELALVKAAQPRVDASTQALLSRIDRLEAQLAGRAPVPVATQPPAPPRAVPAPRPEGAREGERPREVPPPRPEETREGEPLREVPAPRPEGDRGEPLGGNGRPLHAVPEPPRAEPQPQPEPEHEPAGASAAHATAIATAEVEHSPPAVQHAIDDLPPAGGPLDLAAIRAVWPAVVDTVKNENLMLGATIAKARPCEVRGDELVIAFGHEDSFYRRKAEDQACRQLVGQAIRSLTGTTMRLVYDSRDDDVEPEQAPTLSEDEIIDRFKAEFEAEEIVPHDDEEPRA
jgi:DNA polymerase-3 subunit gamma/tau